MSWQARDSGTVSAYKMEVIHMVKTSGGQQRAERLTGQALNDHEADGHLEDCFAGYFWSIDKICVCVMYVEQDNFRA